MYRQMIQEEHQPKLQPEHQSPEQYEYQRRYPRYSSVRLSHTNINRIKTRANRYNQTINDLVIIILGHIIMHEKGNHILVNLSERSKIQAIHAL
jgi:NRPS condensation-like uncharacterized protein